MKITRTITIDGRTPAEFEQIKEHLEELRLHHPEWVLVQEPLVNRMTAVATVHVETLSQAS